MDRLRQFPAHKSTKLVVLCSGAIILSLTAAILWRLATFSDIGTMVSSGAVIQGIRGPYIGGGFNLVIYLLATTLAAVYLWVRIAGQAIKALKNRRSKSKASRLSKPL
jgi:hypothetical protein